MPSSEELELLKIPFEKIVSATNNFNEKNLIKDGSHAKIYKGEGELLQSGLLINIAVVMYKETELLMVNGILMFADLKHKNLNSVLWLCEDTNEIIVVHKYAANGSLDKHLSGATLTWIQRLRICVAVSHALSYIHYDVGRDFSVIHGNIKSSKILLDDFWEPKLSGFEFPMELSVAERHNLRLTSKYMGTLQYMDPSYEKTKGLTHKSDIFSFGMVLFEILFGREASIPNEDNWYFARLARLHYEKKTLDDMINPDLRKQMNLQSLKIFSEVAYRCLKEQRTQRPYIDQIVKQLESALQLQEEHENHIHSTVAVKGTSSNHLKGKNLEHLKIQLSDIVLATENFAEAYRIGSGGYGVVYKAKLYHFDDQTSSGIKGKHTDELPRRRSDVAIKRIYSRDDGQGEKGFLIEVQMLTSCKHPNVVSLLGYCDEGLERILVYEHASNGSLDDYLGNTNNMTTLTWAQRIKICLDIACGLKYLHTKTGNKQKIIHRDMKSDNILLDENWEAKIADFGLSKFHPANQQTATMITGIAGTQVYLDPEYEKTNKLKKESDIYSFGVVLFEILCGRLAYDRIYTDKNEKGLAPIARQCYIKGTLQEMIDPKLKEEVDENIFSLNRGPNQESLDTFSEIAYKCVSETQANRPTMEIIIEELEKALSLQENQRDNLRIPFEHIKLATQNFSDDNCIGGGGFWKEYRGELPHANGNTTVVIAKRLDYNVRQRDHKFLIELQILFKFKHENIIGLVGYCNEMDENIIVSEYACNGSLDRYLNDFNLTWAKRLKICIDVASGLAFLQGVGSEDTVIHKDIKASNILLNGDWTAKIANFGRSGLIFTETNFGTVLDDAYSTSGCVDPDYREFKLLYKTSDIYSFGMVLLEILCGRLMYPKDCLDYSQPLSPQIDWYYHYQGKSKEIVFEGIKEQIVQESLDIFYKIALQCLDNDSGERPWARDVVKQLKEALEIQEDYEIWEPKLPVDYTEIIQMSKTPEIYNTKRKKDLYDMFCKGILLQEGKVWFSLGSNGERSKMMSSKMLSYRNKGSREWRSTPESRFSKVTKMSDISNLKIQMKMRTQLLSPDVNYGVHLVFKFCEPIKFSSKPVYVNLKYKMGKEKLHAYFATQRDDEWMMIELFRFVNQKEITNFEVVLESFSRYYCRTGAIYVEGLEFRAIDNVTHKEIENLKEVQQVLKSNSNFDQWQQLSINCEEIFRGRETVDDGGKHVWLSEVNGKISLRISANKLLRYPNYYVKFSYTEPSVWSRSERVVELLPQQVFRIICNIKVQWLSPNTDYVCYLVFKISTKCRGLHCPVKVRDLHSQKNEEPKILYLRSPSLPNRHEVDLPEQREDGWMEVNLWKFNSNCKTTYGYIRMNLKLISYEGTMNGVIVCGLEVRPM